MLVRRVSHPGSGASLLAVSGHAHTAFASGMFPGQPITGHPKRALLATDVAQFRRSIVQSAVR